jgi:hypothetical protein
MIFPPFPHTSAVGFRLEPMVRFFRPNLGQLINYVFEYRAKEAVEKLTGDVVTAKH